MKVFSSGKLADWLKDHRVQFWLVFVALIALRFWPFLQGKTLLFGDNYSLMVPGKIFTAAWLKEGVLPLWNPYLFSGIPWLADISQSVLYPSTLLFVLFSPATAFNLTIVAHVLLAYAGMYLLARVWLKDHSWALLAGVLWLLSTQVTGSINNLSTIQSIVWLPWLSWLGLRLVQDRWSRLWFAGVVLLQLMGGYPQHALYSVLLAVGLSWFRRGKSVKEWFSAWFWTGAISFWLTAVAWLPFLKMLLASTRLAQTEAQAVVGSMHPASLIKLGVPYFFDHAAHGIKWGPAWSGQSSIGMYGTWLGLVAVVGSLFTKAKSVKREVKLFAGIVLASLLFSLGEYLPGFAFIQRALPLFRIARYPSMIMIVANVVLVLWTARALQNLKISSTVFRWLKLLSLSLFTVGLLGWWVQHNYFETLWQTVDRFASFSLSQSPFHTAERDSLIMFEIVRNIVFNSIFFLASLFIFTAKKLKNGVLLLALVLGLEMAFNTQGQLFFAPREVYVEGTASVEILQQNTELTSTAYRSRLLTRNSNLPYTDYGSYWEALIVREPFSDSFVIGDELVSFAHAKNLRDGFTPDWNAAFGVPVVNGYTTLLPQDYAAIWQHSADPRINFIDQLNPADPLLDEWAVRYYLVDTWFTVEEDLSEFPVVYAWDRWEVRERLGSLDRIRLLDGSPVELSEFSEDPNRMSFSVELAEPDSLLIADRFDDDWRATVNGSAVEVKEYQGMRQLELGVGTSRVELVYFPHWFSWGLVMTILTGAGTIAVLFRSRKS